MPWDTGCVKLCVKQAVRGSLGYANELQSPRKDTLAPSSVWQDGELPDLALLWSTPSCAVSFLNKFSYFACYHPHVSVQFLVLGHKDTEPLWNFQLTPISTNIDKLACPSKFLFLYLSETHHPLCAKHAQPIAHRSRRAINVGQHRIVSSVTRLEDRFTFIIIKLCDSEVCASYTTMSKVGHAC